MSINHPTKEGTMNYRVTFDGVTVARFVSLTDAKFFADKAVEADMFGAHKLEIIARNGETMFTS